jgi:putative endonuclease
MGKTLPDSKILASQAAQRGQWAEQQACDWLINQGLVLLERNSRFRGGEIDLVMRDASLIVFVEVRYRSSLMYGGALESLDLQRSFGASSWPACRFDVVLFQAGKRAWIPGAF